MRHFCWLPKISFLSKHLQLAENSMKHLPALHLGCLEDTQFFFSAPAQREALARLHFALEHSLEFAILTGDSGSGKSSLFTQFQRALRTIPCQLFQCNLAGLTPAQLTLLFAAELGVETNGTEQRVWSQITRRVTELSYNNTPLVVLCDDAQTATPAVLEWLSRLWGLLPADRWHTTILFALRSDSVAALPLAWQERIELRIELESWSLEDIRDFLQANGATTPLPRFEEAAVVQLLELSGGLPRKVRRLARLALLAAASQNLFSIDAPLLLGVSEELCGMLS